MESVLTSSEILRKVRPGSRLSGNERRDGRRRRITNNKIEIVEIPIPPDLKGRHILKIIASNPQSDSDEDSETFVVRKKTRFLTPFSFKGLINFLHLF